PDQVEAAADVADFCLRAIKHLACDQRTGTHDVGEVGDWILRESDERWRDYLSLVDPINTGEDVAAEPALCDQDPLPQADEPPAIDAQALLRLLIGTGDGGAPLATPEACSGPQRKDVFREPPIEAVNSNQSPGRPEMAILGSTQPKQSPAEPVAAPRESVLEIPPLPGRFDLDDEMRAAFLAAATDRFG